METCKKIRVVKIIDDMNIVLNCGENDGIEEGTRFVIYSFNGTKVTDPITNEDLGSFRGIKAKVIAINVFEKMCICQNSVTIGGMSDFAALSFAPLIGRRASLNVDPSQISGGLNEKIDEPIIIGDEAEILKKTN